MLESVCGNVSLANTVAFSTNCSHTQLDNHQGRYRDVLSLADKPDVLQTFEG